MKKLILTVLALLVLGAAATPFAGAYMLRRYVSKERLVLETEKNINARVQLDDVTLTLFSWPPTLRLSGIKIAPRDDFAGTPLDTRPPLQDAPVKIEMAYLELVPEGLWHKQFFPRVLRILGADVQEFISHDQGSSLEKLFQPPGTSVVLTPDGVPKAIPLPSTPTVVQESAEPAVAAVPQVDLPVNDQPRAARLALQEISIEGARFRIRNQSADSRFDGEISDFNLSLTEIDIDPADLGGHNHLKVRLSAKVLLDGMAALGGRMQQVRFADMTIHGEGDVAPVNATTLTWSPAAMLKLTIDKGSLLGGHMTIGDAAGDHLEKLMKYGIDLRGVRIGGQLAQDLAVHVLSKDEGVTFLSDAHLALPDYQVTVKRDSWMNFAKDDQGLMTRLYCGEALKEQIVRGISSRGINSTLSRMIVDGFSDDQGRFAFDLTITGSLSHPEVKPDIQRRLEGLLGSDIEDKAKGLIDTFKGLRGLFKK